MTSPASQRALRRARVLLVGAGGLGAPLGEAMVRAGVGHLTVLDDDRVELSNLHRQLLFTERDLGRPKAVAAAEALAALADATGSPTCTEPLEGRLLPGTAVELFAAHDLVLEGADNLETKFLALDAAAATGVPAAQAGVVRWSGWALLSVPGRAVEAACLRCLFEDLPSPGEGCESCREAGVVGPAVGVLGAVQAALALRWLLGDRSAAGERWSYDGVRGRLGRSRPRPRPGCPACAGRISGAQVRDASRYGAPARLGAGGRPPLPTSHDAPGGRP